MPALNVLGYLHVDHVFSVRQL